MVKTASDGLPADGPPVYGGATATVGAPIREGRMTRSRNMIPRIPALVGLVLAATGAAGPAAGGGAGDAAPPGQPRHLADGVHLLPGNFVAGRQPDGNTVILAGPTGLVVFDTGRHPEHAARILAHARDLDRPLAAVINSHWHLDHVSGNLPLRQAFPALEVHAGEAMAAALDGFLADYRRQLVQALETDAPTEQQAAWRAEIGRIDSGPQLLPTHPLRGDERRRLGGRDLELHLETDAVSGGDVWVYDPASRILLAGDLVTLPAPLFDTACPTGWRAALERLRAVDFAVLVPGHGPPLGRRELDRYIAAYDRLLACAGSGATTADCAADWLDALGTLVPGGDRELGTQLLTYYVEQVLRGDRAQQYCPAAAGVSPD